MARYTRRLSDDLKWFICRYILDVGIDRIFGSIEALIHALRVSRFASWTCN